MAMKLYREEDIQDVADAIREKTDSENTFTPGEMGDAVRAIETGTDTSDADVAAGDVRAGKIFYGADGQGTGALAEVAQATPSLSVSDGGLITAVSQQAGGIVQSGTKTATQQLQTMAGQTVTPSQTQQTIQTAGKYLTGDIVVQPGSGAENILARVSDVSVTDNRIEITISEANVNILGANLFLSTNRTPWAALSTFKTSPAFMQGALYNRNTGDYVSNAEAAFAFDGNKIILTPTNETYFASMKNIMNTITVSNWYVDAWVERV